MAQPIRIAMLGVQHYHANFWTKATLQSERAVVAGVWDPVFDLAQEFATAHAVECVGDIDQLLACADAVAICSATIDHKALIAAAVAAGKPILCEKPLGISTEHGAEIRTLLDSLNSCESSYRSH